MERSKLLELTQFFKNLEIEEEDVTSDLQRANGQFVVIVTYTYDNKKYITKKTILQKYQPTRLYQKP